MMVLEAPSVTSEIEITDARERLNMPVSQFFSQTSISQPSDCWNWFHCWQFELVEFFICGPIEPE